jgi:hypothetical protein
MAGIYTPQVIAKARELGITELQAYRHEQARNYLLKHRLRFRDTGMLLINPVR